MIRVPSGTTVVDEDTLEILGDMAQPGARLVVARGGAPGFGNTHYKSSTNRAPRRTTPGLSRRDPSAAPATESARRRRSARHAERRQVDAARARIGVAAEDRRLPVHDVDAEPRRRARRRRAQFRDGRHSRPDRRCGRWARASARSSCVTSRVAACCCISRKYDRSTAANPVANVTRDRGRSRRRYSPTLMRRPRWLVLTKLDLAAPDDESDAVTRLDASGVSGSPVVCNLRRQRRRHRCADGSVDAPHRRRAAHRFRRIAELVAAEAALDAEIGADVLRQSLAAATAAPVAQADARDADADRRLPSVEVIYRAD